MGVFQRQSDNMKMLVVLALAALAYAEPEADADAYLLYGAYGNAGYTGYPYGYYGYPYAYGKRSADAEPEADALYGYYGYGYGLRPYGYYGGYRTYGYPYRYYGKRSADAEPEADAEADPALLYTTTAVHHPVTSTVAHTPLVYNTLPLTHSLYNALPVVSTAVPAETKTKREAEPEADPALVYTTGLTTPYVHHALPTVYN